MNIVYHPLAVIGGLDFNNGSFPSGTGSAEVPDDPDFGTTLYLHNNRPCPVWIHGVRVLNQAWDVVILSIGPVRGPFDAAAFNLDAVPMHPAGTGHRYPAPEKPRFVHFPMGFLRADEKMPVRACPYGSPSMWPTLNMLFFVEDSPGASDEELGEGYG